MRLLKIFLAVLAVSGFSFPALAQDNGAPGNSGLTLDWTPVPILKTDDGKFEIKLRGRALLDYAWVNDSDNSLNFNGTEFRTARLGIDGRYGKKFKFRFEADFAHKTVTFKDIYIQYEGVVTLTAGHIKFAAPMESSSSSRYFPFMERGGFNNAFAFGRQVGVALTKPVGNGLVEIGIGKGGFAAKGSDSTGFKFAARATQAFAIDGGTIHLGTSFTYLETGDNQANFRYRERPLQHQAPRFINTGSIADSQAFVGVEAGLFTGPFSLVGEAGVLKADLSAPLPGQGDPTFWGGHVTVGYFLTGEDSPYSSGSGTYSRPKVKRPFFKGGPGAVQIAARYDFLDLVDNGIFGGVQKTFVFGLNWWMGKNVKLAFNYSHSDITQAFLVAANGVDGANKVNAFGIRTQIDW